MLALTHLVGARICCVLMLVGSLAACNKSAEGPLTSEEAHLLESLSMTDQRSVSDQLDAWSKRTNESVPRPETTSALLDVWLKKEQDHPDWSWETLGRSDVRMRVARVLTNANHNRRIELPDDVVNEMHSFALGRVKNVTPNSIDEPEVADAVLVLGATNVGTDADDLERVARTGGSARVTDLAILSLALLCDPEGGNALERLKADRGIATESLFADAQALRAAKQAGACTQGTSR